jgi:transcriptional regulator with XRE-family HTH domain
MSVRFHRGDYIRKLRENREWTQADLAQHAGIDKNTVNRIEADHEGVTLDSVAKACRALGVLTEDVDPGRSKPTLETSVPATETAKDRLTWLVKSLDKGETAETIRVRARRDEGPDAPGHCCRQPGSASHWT